MSQLDIENAIFAYAFFPLFLCLLWLLSQRGSR